MGTPASYLQHLILFIRCSFLLEVSFAWTMHRENTSTDEANTPIIGQKLKVIMVLASGMAALIFCFILDKHKLKQKNNETVKVSDETNDISKSLEKEDWWGLWRRFSWSDLEIVTNRFAKENLIGQGLYGTVYKGYLNDGTPLAVKILTGSRGQAKEIFDVEFATIGNGMHNCLANIIGFCGEGAKRCIVYEYVDNGNLKKWLHGNTRRTSPLTWDIRMKIAIQIANGLADLHQGLIPKVVHGNVKSSNILLDKDWNAKVTDLGLAKLVKPEKRDVSPDYATKETFYEGSEDVYSFGVLLIELLTGRSPSGEMSLVEWFKRRATGRRRERLLDPKMRGCPSPIVLARTLMVCLQCIDDDVSKRPTMTRVVMLLEAPEHLFELEPLPPIQAPNWFNFLYKRVLIKDNLLAE